MKSKLSSWGSGCAAAVLLALPTQSSVLTVAYYRLGEADPGAVAGQTAVETTTDSGGNAALTRTGTAPVYAADTGVAGSVLSLEVNGGGYARNTPVVTLADNWGLEAWVQADTAEGVASLVYNGNSGGSGMGLYAFNGGFIGLLGGRAFVGSEPITPGAWTHLAIVVMNGSTTFYVNGTPNASAGPPAVPAGTFCVGIRPDGGEAFRGKVDEVRVFSFEADLFSTDDLLLTRVPPDAQPPAIVSGPTASPGPEVIAGDALTLSVLAGGTPPLAYQWRKAGVDLPGATTDTLTFAAAAREDSGEYSVVISSPHGTATSTSLTVTVQPAGSPGLVPVAYYRLGENDPGAVAGQFAGVTTQDAVGSLHLDLTGNPATYSAATGVAGSTLCLALQYSGYVREAPLVTVADNWGIEAWARTEYLEDNHCIAYNGDSASSGMGIYQLGDRYVGMAGGVAVVGGAPVTPGAWTHLAIVVTGGTSTFYVNGVSTGSGGRPNAATSGSSAFFVGMKPDWSEPFDGDLDEVRAFTVIPGHFSAGDLLLMRVPPGALAPFVVSGPTASPGNTLLAGSPLTLQVVAGGTAPLEYQWRKGGSALSGAIGDTFSVSAASPADAGRYDVVVKNAYGEVTSPEITVTVFPVGTPTVTTVAYYRLGEEDAGAAAGVPAREVTTDSAGFQDLAVVGWTPTYAGDTGVSGSTLCLAMDGGGYRHESALIEDGQNWGLEAWVMGDTTEQNRCLVYNGNSSDSGMGLYQIGNQFLGLVGGVAFVGGAPIVPGQWVHLALVTEGGNTTFYVNGAVNATRGGLPRPPTSAGSAFSLGLKNDQDEMFSGRLDEVRLFRVRFPGQFATRDLLLTRVPPGGEPPSVVIQRSAEGLVITWTAGTLEQAETVTGPWTPVDGATSPWPLTPTGVGRFFRAVGP